MRSGQVSSKLPLPSDHLPEGCLFSTTDNGEYLGFHTLVAGASEPTWTGGIAPDARQLLLLLQLGKLVKAFLSCFYDPFGIVLSYLEMPRKVRKKASRRLEWQRQPEKLSKMYGIGKQYPLLIISPYGGERQMGEPISKVQTLRRYIRTEEALCFIHLDFLRCVFLKRSLAS